jgi:adenylate cyclase
MTARSRLRQRRLTVAIGLGLAGLLPMLLFAPGWGVAETWRLAAFDAAARLLPRPAGALAVIVVDIDRPSLARFGAWPWPRATHAQLLEAVAARKPAAVAYDMLLGAGAASEAADLQRLANAIRLVPTVLALVLDPISPNAAPPPAATLIDGQVSIGQIMQEDGVAGPPERLREAAAGLGVISLGSAESAVVRSVPLLAAGGTNVYAGLAAEAVRVSRGASAFILGGAPPRLETGGVRFPLNDSASLRLWLSSEINRAARTVSARDVVDGRAGLPSLADKIVIIGSSAPELGGLRAAPGDPFISSADIQATAIEQALAGRFLLRPSGAGRWEFAAAVASGIGGLIAVLLLPPLAAGLCAILLAAGWAIAGLVMFAQGILIDPLTPAIAGLVAFQGAALASFAEQRERRAEVERRFAQHLPPEVVRRLADDPDTARLAGEQRIITALFTDIEGFTALGERADPRDLVSLLDRYVEVVCAVIVEHGGTVDKIVGDAVHAYFNTPVDLPEHPRKAVLCALAVIEASERVRREPLARRLDLGRTRIGVETGSAIVGDVGGGRRFDYTAHGPAVNTAAKLEAANKRFGSSIAVGPVATAQVTGIAFRPLGLVQPSSDSQPILAEEPWPQARPEDVADFRRAYAAVTRDPARAVVLFDDLARRFPEDRVIESWRERLSGARFENGLSE